MRLYRASACLLMVAYVMTGLLPAQQPVVQASSGQFHSGHVAPASYSTAAFVLERPDITTEEPQLRVSVAYMMVDDETRKSIYDRIGDKNVNTTTQAIPESSDQPLPSAREEIAQSSQSFQRTSYLSTSVLTETLVGPIQQLVHASAASHVMNAPSIILVDDIEAKLDDIRQRPFVVGMSRRPVTENTNASTEVTDANGASQLMGPDIQVLDEGTSIRIVSRRLDDQRVHLATQIKNMKIVEVSTTPVFGLGEGNTVLQSPVQKIETATAARNLELGETLLVDPYISDNAEIREQRGVPVLGKIPYLSKSFKNVTITREKLNWIVLIKVQEAS